MSMYYDVIIIGSGCAAYATADRLYGLGQQNIAILTEGVNMGTSRNTGSDKQTYYKLSVGGDAPDSVYDMARTLFDGGSVHGDTAYAEAACSVRAFMRLVELGIPFPTNAYGEYVGYKTDHDPRRRATSCGPYTSRLMTEALQRSVESKGIATLDRMQAIKLHTDEHGIRGVTAISTHDYAYHTYACANVVLATGGPAGIYADSVYPQSQTGGTGLAIDAGAILCNMQEWQYGIASVDFRWNLSGTYQQVLPRYVSVSPDGTQREFLPEQYDDPCDALNNVFLKGYQWPFDVRRLDDSSDVDVHVYREIRAGNAVYLDYTRNPVGLECGFDGLSDECRMYLERSGALFGTPYERLLHMNPQAVALYKSNGIDLSRDLLRINVCAQHCNGGVAVDADWQSGVQGLYAVGEAAGTFGVYRPGGSALNSTQVGALRAAEHICMARRQVCGESPTFAPPRMYCGESEFAQRRAKWARDMSRYAAFIRDSERLPLLLQICNEQRCAFFENACIAGDHELPALYKAYDILCTTVATLCAMCFADQHIGTRGAYRSTAKPQPVTAHTDKVIHTQKTLYASTSYFEPVRPLPQPDDWFENVWREYNARHGIS